MSTFPFPKFIFTSMIMITTFDLIFLNIALITCFSWFYRVKWSIVCVVSTVPIFTWLFQAALSQRIICVDRIWWSNMLGCNWNDGDSLLILLTKHQNIFCGIDIVYLIALYLLPCMFWWWHGISHPWPSGVFLLVYYVQTLTCVNRWSLKSQLKIYLGDWPGEGVLLRGGLDSLDWRPEKNFA